MFLWATLEGDFDAKVTLNLPSLKKLSKALDLTSDEEVSFKLNSNNLEYKGKDVKFKYHLHDDGILNKPKVSLDKIKSFKYDVDLVITKTFLTQLLKNSSIFNDTKKLYIYTEDDHVIWSLADKTLSNTDTLTIIGCDVDFEFDTFILDLENLRSLSLSNDSDITFRMNTTMGIGCFELKYDDLDLKYIMTSLTR